MRVKTNNKVLVQLPPKARSRAPTIKAQQKENTNLKDFYYEIPQTSSIGALLNTIL